MKKYRKVRVTQGQTTTERLAIWWGEYEEYEEAVDGAIRLLDEGEESEEDYEWTAPGRLCSSSGWAVGLAPQGNPEFGEVCP